MGSAFTFTKKAPTTHPVPGAAGVAAKAMPKKTLNWRTQEFKNERRSRGSFYKKTSLEN